MISLLEAISPTSRTLLSMPKCISKAEKLKVHAMSSGGTPLCGGGHQAKSVTQWQTDIGPINCGACLAIISKENS